MGNRLSRKKQRGSAAGAAPTQDGVVSTPAPSSAPQVPWDVGGATRPDETSTERKVVELPLSARQAPPTARDADGSGGSPLDFFRRCYTLEEDPFTLYTQALLLKGQREFAAASELLRSLVANPHLTLEARYHLAQCLFAQDPALSWCREEAGRCLEDVVLALKSSPINADAHRAIMYRESLELLAHVMIAARQFNRALELLDALQAKIDKDSVAPSEVAGRRQQQTLVSFQRAFCRYARGDSPDIVSAELLGALPRKADRKDEQQEPETSDPLEGIELLLHADAASLREGLALLATST